MSRLKGKLLLRRLEPRSGKLTCYLHYGVWYITKVLQQADDEQFYHLMNGKLIHELSLFELVVSSGKKPSDVEYPLKSSQWQSALRANNITLTNRETDIDFILVSLDSAIIAKAVSPFKDIEKHIDDIILLAYSSGKYDEKHGYQYKNEDIIANIKKEFTIED